MASPGRNAAATRRRVLAGLAALPAFPAAALAQRGFPDRPVRLVVPFGPGSATDALIRQLSTAMATALGQPVVVDNRPGANTIVAAEHVARSSPDGYTVLVGLDGTMCYNPVLFPQRLPYDPLRDFTAVAGLTAHPLMLVVSPGLPARSVPELVALAKAQPGRLSYATVGVASAMHLAAESFQREAGIEMTHVPYNNIGQMQADLLTGNVQVMFWVYQQLKPHLDAERVRPLANPAMSRRMIPGLPTMPELGFPRSAIAPWVALYAPAGTPADRVARLSQAAKVALENQEIRTTLAEAGIEISYRTPAEIAAFTAAEAPLCRELIAMSGARID
jgi:tripartite-type tricarboxylate transporter receptor subunit TctC